MAHKVFPTEANIGAAAGSLTSRSFTETKWRKVFSGMPYSSRVISGLDYDSATGLTADFNAGTALINGYFVEMDAFSVVIPASSTKNVFAYLAPTGDVDFTSVNGVDFDTNIIVNTGVPLAQLVTDGSTVTSDTDMRDLTGGVLRGTASGASPVIKLGFQPGTVLWHAFGTGGAGTVTAAWGASYNGGGGWAMNSDTGTGLGVPNVTTGQVTFGNYQATIASTVTKDTITVYYEIRV